MLLDKFPWLVSERGHGDKALIRIIKDTKHHTSRSVNTAKFLLQHMQATPGLLLVDVDKLLAAAAWAGWADMCRMLIADGHADAWSVVQVSNSGRQLELCAF